MYLKYYLFDNKNQSKHLKIKLSNLLLNLNL